jgi:hypothetical protein
VQKAGWHGHTHGGYVDELSRTANAVPGERKMIIQLAYMLIEGAKPKLRAYEI